MECFEGPTNHKNPTEISDQFRVVHFHHYDTYSVRSFYDHGVDLNNDFLDKVLSMMSPKLVALLKKRDSDPDKSVAYAESLLQDFNLIKNSIKD